MSTHVVLTQYVTIGAVTCNFLASQWNNRRGLIPVFIRARCFHARALFCRASWGKKRSARFSSRRRGKIANRAPRESECRRSATRVAKIGPRSAATRNRDFIESLINQRNDTRTARPCCSRTTVSLVFAVSQRDPGTRSDRWPVGSR